MIARERSFIGALDPAAIAQNWDNPIGKGDFRALRLAGRRPGAAWLAYVLYADASSPRQAPG